MISVENLLDMVATESIEEFDPLYPSHGKPSDDLPPIDYRLELIQGKDGRLYWVE